MRIEVIFHLEDSKESLQLQLARDVISQAAQIIEMFSHPKEQHLTPGRKTPKPYPVADEPAPEISSSETPAAEVEVPPADTDPEPSPEVQETPAVVGGGGQGTNGTTGCACNEVHSL